MGFVHIFIAGDQKEALGLASKCRFHIMITSVKIGDGYDGVDTVKVLQEIYDLSVIFICSYRNEEILSKVAEANFLGYLLKPCRKNELQTLVFLAGKKHQLKEPSSSIKVSGTYSFDLNENTLYQNDEVISLTKKEKLFFLILFNNINTTVHYATLDELVWFGGSVTDNTRRTFIYRIKKRFPDLPLYTVNNIGIKLS
jgi:DNA-binding response OmpR family regulator